MTYYEHFLFALKMASVLLIASIKSIIHAFIPFWFETSTTDTIEFVTKEIKENGCRYKSDKA